MILLCKLIQFGLVQSIFQICGKVDGQWHHNMIFVVVSSNTLIRYKLMLCT